MRIVPTIDMRTKLTLAVLLILLVSWVVTNGAASYMVYHRFKVLRQEMLSDPQMYPRPLPEPRFRITDLLVGPRLPGGPGPDRERRGPRGGRGFGPPPQEFRPEGPRMMPGLMPPPDNAPPEPAPGQGPPEPFGGNQMDSTLVMLRALVALVLAIVAGVWLSRRFARPLSALAAGATAYQAGDFSHRIPAKGDDEFTRVASAMNTMADRVSEQIGKLEEDAKRRQQFLADVAHELRSPVTTMRTMAGALEDGTASDPERAKLAANSLVRTSERLARLVTDLLMLARLDLKELPMHPRSIDLCDAASAAVAAHGHAAAEAGVVLHTVECPSHLNVHADPDRMTQVLDNLLDNAISYAGKGAQVRVSVRAEGRSAVVRVSDNGAGIPAEHIDNIFEPFYRVDTVRSTVDSHSGLGLRIARALVEAQGGELVLESIERKGTTVTIILPLK